MSLAIKKQESGRQSPPKNAPSEARAASGPTAQAIFAAGLYLVCRTSRSVRRRNSIAIKATIVKTSLAVVLIRQPSAVRRKISAIGRREIGWSSGMRLRLPISRTNVHADQFPTRSIVEET
jgi:hypothetical protein